MRQSLVWQGMQCHRFGQHHLVHGFGNCRRRSHPSKLAAFNTLQKIRTSVGESGCEDEVINKDVGIFGRYEREPSMRRSWRTSMITLSAEQVEQ
jgi:hypothetical protein